MVRSSVLLPKGFHGDRFLIEAVHSVLKDAEYFVETGTNVGSTIRFVATKYNAIQCLSCEPDENGFRSAGCNTQGLDNVELHNVDAITFLNTLPSVLPATGKRVVCWLDAHGCGFRWPLREEVDFFTKQYPDAIIFIDDFKVPGNDKFGYDQYDGQECSLSYIRDVISDDAFEIGYPTYSEHTSSFHPLRVWCVLRRGEESNTAIPHCTFETV